MSTPSTTQTGNLFGVWITQSLTDPAHTYPYLLQGGLGLPDRDYYLSATPQMSAFRNLYRAHIEAMLRLAGLTEAPARATRVFALETAMARCMRSSRPSSRRAPPPGRRPSGWRNLPPLELMPAAHQPFAYAQRDLVLKSSRRSR